MNKKKLAHFRKQLEAFSSRLDGDIATLEGQARADRRRVRRQPVQCSHASGRPWDRGLPPGAQCDPAGERIHPARRGHVGDGAGRERHVWHLRKLRQEDHRGTARIDPLCPLLHPCAEKLQAGKDTNLNEGRPAAPTRRSARMTRALPRNSRGPITPAGTSRAGAGSRRHGRSRRRGHPRGRHRRRRDRGGRTGRDQRR